MMTLARSTILAAGIALMTACGSEEPAPQPAVPPPSKPVATAASAAPEKPAPDMARGVVTGKPVAGVDLYYELKSKPQVGQAVDIDLLLTATVGIDRLEASISGMDGLRIVAPTDSKFTASDLAAGDEIRQTLTVVPEVAGAYYASFMIKTDGETGVQARTFALPMVVGQVTAAEKVAPATDAAGEPVRSLPAEEKGG